MGGGGGPEMAASLDPKEWQPEARCVPQQTHSRKNTERQKSTHTAERTLAVGRHRENKRYTRESSYGRHKKFCSGKRTQTDSDCAVFAPAVSLPLRTLLSGIN